MKLKRDDKKDQETGSFSQSEVKLDSNFELLDSNENPSKDLLEIEEQYLKLIQQKERSLTQESSLKNFSAYSSLFQEDSSKPHIRLQEFRLEVEDLLAPFLREENKASFVKLVKRYRATYPDVFMTRSQQVPNQTSIDREIWDSREQLALQINNCFYSPIDAEKQKGIFEQLKLQNEKLQKDVNVSENTNILLLPKTSQELTAQQNSGLSDRSQVVFQFARSSRGLEMIIEEPEIAGNILNFDQAERNFAEEAEPLQVSSQKGPVANQRFFGDSDSSDSASLRTNDFGNVDLQLGQNYTRFFTISPNEEFLDSMFEPLLKEEGKEHFIELVSYYLNLVDGVQKSQSNHAREVRWRNRKQFAQAIKSYLLCENRLDPNRQDVAKEGLFQQLQTSSYAAQEEPSLPSSHSSSSSFSTTSRAVRLAPRPTFSGPAFCGQRVSDVFNGLFESLSPSKKSDKPSSR